MIPILTESLCCSEETQGTYLLNLTSAFPGLLSFSRGTLSLTEVEERGPSHIFLPVHCFSHGWPLPLLTSSYCGIDLDFLSPLIAAFLLVSLHLPVQNLPVANIICPNELPFGRKEATSGHAKMRMFLLVSPCLPRPHAGTSTSGTIMTNYRVSSRRRVVQSGPTHAKAMFLFACFVPVILLM